MGSRPLAAGISPSQKDHKNPVCLSGVLSGLLSLFGKPPSRAKTHDGERERPQHRRKTGGREPLRDPNAKRRSDRESSEGSSQSLIQQGVIVHRVGVAPRKAERLDRRRDFGPELEPPAAAC